MNINKINSSNFSEKDIKKSRESASPEKSTIKSGSSVSKPAKGDRFSPSNIQLTGDFDLGRNELRKLGSDSFSRLRKIKAKIEQGHYNSREVHQKVASFIEKDLGSLEEVLSAASQSADESSSEPSLSPEYKMYLTENPKVVQKVADGVAADIKKL